jgi:FtsH-binding integral membrane protein
MYLFCNTVAYEIKLSIFAMLLHFNKGYSMRLQSKIHLPDILGILASGLCLVHCIASPVLMALLIREPREGAFENLLEFVFLSGSFLAVYFSTRRHTDRLLPILLWFFFAAFAFSVLFEEDFSFTEPMGYIAASGLVISHIANIRHCHKCSKHTTR